MSCASVCGADKWEDIAAVGEAKKLLYYFAGLFILVVSSF
jgi:hypothetical protein